MYTKFIYKIRLHNLGIIMNFPQKKRLDTDQSLFSITQIYFSKKDINTYQSYMKSRWELQWVLSVQLVLL